MKTSSKFKTLLIIFFIVVFSIIAARHFIGQHFQKKFSVRPAPGVIVKEVKRSNFYKSIETFGTAIAQRSKTYKVTKNEATRATMAARVRRRPMPGTETTRMPPPLVGTAG